MYKIESTQNEKVKYWSKLKDKKTRDEEGLFLVEGDHLVKEALKYHLIKEILTLDDNSYDVPTYQVTNEIMKKLTEQQTPPRVIGVCQKLKEHEVLGSVLVLDEIQDPGNLGTILRSAVAFGMKNIVLSPTCVDLYNPKVIRSTEGIFFPLNIIRTDLVSFIEKQKMSNESYVVMGADMNGEDVGKIIFPEPVILVIGNEGQGISKEVRECIDTFVRIPMNDFCESLNAAVSASILMYERSKR